jgi:hypothetical protein
MVKSPALTWDPHTVGWSCIGSPEPTEFGRSDKEGRLVREISVDQNPGGAFGLDVAVFDDTARFAFVDDNTNSLSIWTFPLPRPSGDSN